MGWFTGENIEYPFKLFSISHLITLILLFIVSYLIFLFREQLKKQNRRSLEIAIALSLILFETMFNLWLLQTGYWNAQDSIPLELCSISLLLTIILLFTETRWSYELLLFTSLLGASQAMITPVLYFGFPHFRFIHFFYTHMIMIWVALYYTWVKGYRPTLKSVGKVFLFLNILLPFILLVNKLVDGNYMFLSYKPTTPSLLDYLGPYPWYIFSLEALLLSLSFIIWLILKEKRS